MRWRGSKVNDWRIVPGAVFRLRVILDADLAALALQFALGVEPDGLGVDPVLLLQDALGQGLLRIRVVDGYNGLDDDGPCINAFVGEVYGTVGEFDAVVKGLLLSVCAGKRRQKGRVDVHDAHRESSQEKGRENPHETGEHHQLHVVGLQGVYKLPVVSLPVAGAAVLDHGAGDAVLSGPLEGEGPGVVAEDDPDPGRQGPLFDVVDNGLEVGAASRNEDAKVYDSRHEGLPECLFMK